MPSTAYTNFSASIGDANRLLELYDVQLAAAKPRVPEEAEVLKRASLMMAVTAWETYVEDFLKEFVPPRIAAAKSPEEFESVFNKVAQRWLMTNGKTPPLMAQWTGEGWKALILADFERQIKSLNTPKPENLKPLFKGFLNVTLSDYWSFSGYGYESAIKRLNEIIELRGKVAHVARRLGAVPVKHDVGRKPLKKFLDYFERLAKATDHIASSQ